MLVICNGMPRSASTWSFNVAAGLLKPAEGGPPLRTGYSDDPDHFLAMAAADEGDTVLKCHALTPKIAALSSSGTAKLIYTIRNIADAAVSFMAVFHVDFDHAIAVMDASLHTLAVHRGVGRALILDYNDIANQPDAAAARIAAYLGRSIPRARLVEVAAETSLARMRAKVPSSEDAAVAGRLIQHGGTFYDPATLLNIGHIRDGVPGAGKRTLQPAQIQRIAALLGRYGLTEELQPVGCNARLSY